MIRNLIKIEYHEKIKENVSLSSTNVTKYINFMNFSNIFFLIFFLNLPGLIPKNQDDSMY